MIIKDKFCSAGYPKWQDGGIFIFNTSMSPLLLINPPYYHYASQWLNERPANGLQIQFVRYC